MQTVETETTVIPFPATDTEETPRSGYESVRFNAMKHGILSRLAVLPHENSEEFSGLLAALVEEHQPAGATEMHLVEELAAVIWRKRRVLLAEGATINRGLKNLVGSDVNSPIPAAVPFERGLSSKGTDLQDLMTATPEEVVERQLVVALDLQATERAAAILSKGGTNAYEKAQRALMQDSRDWWDEHVEEESYTADAEGLATFIRETLLPICIRVEKEVRHHYAIKAQTMGEGLQAFKLEKLNRYETHLDRKFERTLAMLLKMKELRDRH